MSNCSDSTPITRDRIRRASCDSCRKKKVKCDGGTPSCRRCTRLNTKCTYSVQKPIGRPARRRILLPLTATLPTLSSHNNAVSTRGSSYGLPLSSPTLMMEALNQLDMDTFLGLPPLADMNTAESNASRPQPGGKANSTCATIDVSSQSNSTPNTTTCSSIVNSTPASTRAATQPSCACLATFYLTMDQLRENEELIFPSGLHFLREITATATEMAHCQICPTRYLSAMQNIQLLGTLITSIAKQYGVILESIEAEANSLSELNKSKSLCFRELASELSGDSSTDTGSNYSMEASPSEWIFLANKTVKGEIYGSNSNNDSFWALLEFLEERQTGWHTIPPCPDFPRMQACEKNPLCIKIIRGAKCLLEALKFHEMDSMLPSAGK